MRLSELHGPGDEALVYEAWRRRLAALLLLASSGLLRLAVHIGRHQHRRKSTPALEFYAEAGAPEGALFIDGSRVGTLPGVQRL